MVHTKYQLLMINYYLVLLGALTISVADPTDLVRVRLQVEGKLAHGVHNHQKSKGQTRGAGRSLKRSCKKMIDK